MFSKEVYVNRRNALKAKMNSGVLLFLGTSEAAVNYPGNTYRYRQDSNFNYFFGLTDPDLAAIIDLESGEEIIFGNDVDIDDIIWMGPQPFIKDKAESVGVSKSFPFAELEKYVSDAKAKGRKVHFLPPYRNHNKILLNKMLGVGFDQMKAQASEEFIKAVVSLRLIKEECEIAELDKACNIGYAMHYTAMKMARLGMVEQELVGVMEGIAISQGLMPSFPIILSQNGETLHNHSHHQVLTDGRLIVIDAGAETNSNYCSDFTRTIPSSGKFTTRQKEIYDIVAAANNHVIEISRPGISYTDVHLSMARIMAQGLKDLNILKGDVDEIVANGAQALMMPHGLGHNMGMDVHDMEDLGENYVGYDDNYKRSTQFGLGSLRMGKMLEKGHVITDEPGIYFIPALIEKWKNEGTNAQFINFDVLEKYYDFGGIRLEDDILITDEGCRLLGSKRLPITTEEVEREMAH
ncbi:MAG: aminopeptidase P family protein [Bacteroidales bacterium]|nr:aminopeptidase P family protein [Bacteroidales bacterium]MBO7257114.1 aminopeptidase P family protein [Bacteroidales bacterium]MBO7284848.1 aminopeptidase P family protein [Bacteroidales bacterium]MBO7323260.1 aminopeptidase P family protein [Bacteroidales bacterium]MBQ5747744.1 aminopeptidase P family protein [Bacteroidales bacterium]